MNANAIDTSITSLTLPFVTPEYHKIYYGNLIFEEYMKNMISYYLIAEKKYGILENSDKIVRDLIVPNGKKSITQYATHRRIAMSQTCKSLFNDTTPIGNIIKNQYEYEYEEVIEEGKYKRIRTGDCKRYNYQKGFKLPSRFTVTFNNNNIFYNNARFTINERILNNVIYSKYSIELLKEIENLTFEFILNNDSGKYEITQIEVQENLENEIKEVQEMPNIIKLKKNVKQRLVLTNSHISLLQNVIGPIFNNNSAVIYKLIKCKYFTSFIKYDNLEESKLYSIIIKERKHIKSNYLNKDMIKIELPTIIYYIVDELRKTNCKLELYNIKAYLENKVSENTFKIIEECFNEEEKKILRMIQCYS